MVAEPKQTLRHSDESVRSGVYSEWLGYGTGAYQTAGIKSQLFPLEVCGQAISFKLHRLFQGKIAHVIFEPLPNPPRSLYTDFASVSQDIHVGLL